MGGPPESSGARRQRAARWIAVAAAVAALFALGRALPLGRWIEELQTWVRGAGALGVLAYALAYVAGALLFVPGIALTLAGGALFGPWLGTVVVSLASTAAAGAAFLVARHAARARVRELARKHPRFGAVDRAIEEGGWRVVFLLRLSPAIPFSASNYLYGLTPVRFWPYLLASWAAMLPATVLYVYLGHAGSAGLAAGGADANGRTPAEWALLGAGLLATAVVTVYVTKLARKALGRRTELADAGEDEGSEAARA